jgi:Phage ABA sandwich domain
MTDNDISAMVAGPQLDTLVAEKVMDRPVKPGEIIPAYSTKIASAWQVFEKLQESYSTCELYWSKTPYAQAGMHYRFTLRPYGYRGLEVWAESAPLVICRAALLSLIEPKG